MPPAPPDPDPTPTAPTAPGPHDALHRPLRLGPVTAPNRVVFGAHHTLFAEPSDTYGEPGLVGPRMVRYLAERAAGGVGTVVCGPLAVHPDSAAMAPNTPIAWDRRVIGGWSLLANAVHEHGALAMVQLAHGGPTVSGGWSKRPAVSFGQVTHRPEGPRRLGPDDVEDLVRHFGRAARHAGAAGLDGVEVDLAGEGLLHGSMITGGDLDGRLRMVRDVLAAVRGAAGDRLAVGVSIGGDEHLGRGGLGRAGWAEAAAALAGDGLIDFVEVTGWPASSLVAPSLYADTGAVVALASAVRARVREVGGAEVPVLAGGRHVTPGEAAGVLGSGAADGVRLVRPLIADSNWVARDRDGEGDAIRRCTGCNESCSGNLVRGEPLTCATNPAVGREALLGTGTMFKAPLARRVVVVGGGPAGLEAAWVAAARGHRVSLLDREPQVGGRLHAAASLPGRGELAEFVAWRLGECRRRGVEVRTGVTATAGSVVALEPDAVVVATGAIGDARTEVAWHPPIVGADGPGVVDHESALTNVLADGPRALGAKVVIADLVGFVEAFGLAELLGGAGVDVTVVSPLAGPDAADPDTRRHLLRRARRAGAAILAQRTVAS
ncbi:MAG: NAD-binding protein, partial [Microthrixaceae bacterium]|nr:NAD-binding protein [Microthrixaceae bacterium]